MKSIFPKIFSLPNIHVVVIHNSQNTETTLVSGSRRMNKETAVYIHNGIFCHKEGNQPSVATWMSVDDIMVSEIRQAYKFKHCII
jgi:hypothetical protein